MTKPMNVVLRPVEDLKLSARLCAGLAKRQHLASAAAASLRHTSDAREIPGQPPAGPSRALRQSDQGWINSGGASPGDTAKIRNGSEHTLIVPHRLHRAEPHMTHAHKLKIGLLGAQCLDHG